MNKKKFLLKMSGSVIYNKIWHSNNFLLFLLWLYQLLQCFYSVYYESKRLLTKKKLNSIIRLWLSENFQVLSFTLFKFLYLMIETFTIHTEKFFWLNATNSNKNKSSSSLKKKSFIFIMWLWVMTIREGLNGLQENRENKS